MYACVCECSGGFFGGVHVSQIAWLLAKPHPHRLTVRELAPRMPGAGRVNEADDVLPAPFARSGIRGLRYKLINVVVVAVLDAVDVA